MTLGEILTAGMNNPDCSFFVGATVGQFLIFRIVIALMVFYFVAKVLDRLILNPILDLIHNKIWRKRK